MSLIQTLFSRVSKTFTSAITTWIVATIFSSSPSVSSLLNKDDFLHGCHSSPSLYENRMCPPFVRDVPSCQRRLCWLLSWADVAPISHPPRSLTGTDCRSRLRHLCSSFSSSSIDPPHSARRFTVMSIWACDCSHCSSLFAPPVPTLAPGRGHQIDQCSEQWAIWTKCPLMRRNQGKISISKTCGCAAENAFCCSNCEKP